MSSHIQQTNEMVPTQTVSTSSKLPSPTTRQDLHPFTMEDKLRLERELVSQDPQILKDALSPSLVIAAGGVEKLILPAGTILTIDLNTFRSSSGVFGSVQTSLKGSITKLATLNLIYDGDKWTVLDTENIR